MTPFALGKAIYQHFAGYTVLGWIWAVIKGNGFGYPAMYHLVFENGTTPIISDHRMIQPELTPQQQNTGELSYTIAPPDLDIDPAAVNEKMDMAKKSAITAAHCKQWRESRLDCACALLQRMPPAPVLIVAECNYYDKGDIPHYIRIMNIPARRVVLAISHTMQFRTAEIRRAAAVFAPTAHHADPEDCDDIHRDQKCIARIIDHGWRIRKIAADPEPLTQWGVTPEVCHLANTTQEKNTP